MFLSKNNKGINLHILLLFCVFLWSSTTPSKYQKPTKKLSLIETTDHVIVVKNNTVFFEYLEQEDFKSPVQIRVIEKPKFGVVSLNADNTFIYSPSLNLCDEEDQFTYQLTTNGISTRVVVSIEILCESLTIFNGIVSNDEKEKKLENFKILGVENYPENTLHIFDDSGIEIYEASGYSNQWNGDVESGKNLLPASLYYYVFNDGQGNYFSGYLRRN